jgi:hypothetical protein
MDHLVDLARSLEYKRLSASRMKRPQHPFSTRGNQLISLQDGDATFLPSFNYAFIHALSYAPLHLIKTHTYFYENLKEEENSDGSFRKFEMTLEIFRNFRGRYLSYFQISSKF